MSAKILLYCSHLARFLGKNIFAYLSQVLKFIVVSLNRTGFRTSVDKQRTWPF